MQEAVLAWTDLQKKGKDKWEKCQESTGALLITSFLSTRTLLPSAHRDTSDSSTDYSWLKINCGSSLPRDILESGSHVPLA